MKLNILSAVISSKCLTWVKAGLRHSAWVGDCAYRYSAIHHPQSDTPAFIQDFINSINAYFQTAFNSVLIKYYMGQTSLGWHSDNEEIHDNSIILSLSVGATATFQLKNMHTGSQFSYDLHHGDVLIMSGGCQKDWQHRILPCHLSTPRVNFTLRRTL